MDNKWCFFRLSRTKSEKWKNPFLFWLKPSLKWYNWVYWYGIPFLKHRSGLKFIRVAFVGDGSAVRVNFCWYVIFHSGRRLPLPRYNCIDYNNCATLEPIVFLSSKLSFCLQRLEGRLQLLNEAPKLNEQHLDALNIELERYHLFIWLFRMHTDIVFHVRRLIIIVFLLFAYGLFYLDWVLLKNWNFWLFSRTVLVCEYPLFFERFKCLNCQNVRSFTF